MCLEQSVVFRPLSHGPYQLLTATRRASTWHLSTASRFFRRHYVANFRAPCGRSIASRRSCSARHCCSYRRRCSSWRSFRCRLSDTVTLCDRTSSTMRAAASHNLCACATALCRYLSHVLSVAHIPSGLVSKSAAWSSAVVQ